MCRHNFYQPITIILERFVQTSNLVEAELFRSSLPSKIVVHFAHNSNPNPARLLFTRNVSKPVYHYWLNNWLVYSTHLRVRVTALGCVLSENEPSSTVEQMAAILSASTSTSRQNKHRYINAKADKNGYQDYKSCWAKFRSLEERKPSAVTRTRMWSR